MGITIDSSIFIAAERGRFDWEGFHGGLNDEPLYLTVVSLAELLHGAERADTEQRRTRRLEFIADVEAHFPLLTFGRETAAEYARIWAGLSTTGNIIGAHDMQIAAIARANGLRVATLNAGEFCRIPGLEVLDASAFCIARATT